MLSKLLRYYHTLKYLKWIQIKYRLLYLVKNKLKWESPIPVFNGITHPISFEYIVPLCSSWLGKNSFRFLNKVEDFGQTIDWNFNQNGKLWTYNLNYFEWLFQPEMSKEEGLESIRRYMADRASLKDGLEPFPTSLRLINWIKFVLYHNIKDEKINGTIHQDAYSLLGRIEYHLMGNHLLENGFALFIAGCYLEDRKLYRKGKAILQSELEEQILADGGHFELSVMYHQLMFFRLMDSIQVSDDTTCLGYEMNAYLRQKAAMMYSWLRQMTTETGLFPHFNDSAKGIAPRVDDLIKYAKFLKVAHIQLPLFDSGYRKFSTSNATLFMDIGKVGPDYIPGHAHADTFSFTLFHKERPIIVEAGTSTYEVGNRRDIERSTSSHNTVEINGTNSVDVWGGFRVAERLTVTLQEDKEDYVAATHDGYRQFGLTLQRSFKMNENGFEVKDTIHPTTSRTHSIAYLHLHPEVTIEQVNPCQFVLSNQISLSFSAGVDVEIEPYLFSEEWNTLIPAQKLKIKFVNQLTTTITL